MLKLYIWTMVVVIALAFAKLNLRQLVYWVLKEQRNSLETPKLTSFMLAATYPVSCVAMWAMFIWALLRITPVLFG